MKSYLVNSKLLYYYLGLDICKVKALKLYMEQLTPM